MKRCFVLVAIIAFAFNLKAQEKPAFKLFFEKVYLHTDRNLYTQGDTLWFKAYLVNAQNNQPIGTSGNLYVDLIEQDSAKVIASEIIRMDYGNGNGDISLSDSIPSGKYTLRAYTNWMRNFGDNFIFEKEITILNTLLKKADKVPVVRKKEKAAKVEEPKTPPVAKVPVCRFYPEGGSLITGVSSIVAVKTEDWFGKGITAKGAVLSSAGDTVAHFSCDTLGMGLFVLSPASGQAYHAIINTKNQQNLNADLPQPLNKGFSIRVSHSDSLINVVIGCNGAELAEVKGRSFTLSGKHGGKTYFNQFIQITEIQSLIRIDNNLLPDGITAITLTDDQSKSHCERLVYINHKSASLTIATDKTQYQSKEKVTVNIKTNVGKANLSMAVVDAEIVPVQPENIQSYLMLQSELKGEIEQPNRYFDTTNVNRSKQLDMLLMTQGWRDFIWRRLADSAIRLSYAAQNGMPVTGTVKNEKSEKAIPGLNITLFAGAAKGTKMFTGNTDSTGRFEFELPDYYGEHFIKLASVDGKGEKKGTFYMDTLKLLPVKVLSKVDTDASISLLAAVLKKQNELRPAGLKGARVLKEVKINASKLVDIDDDGNKGIAWGEPQVFNISPKDYEYKTLEWFGLQNIKGSITDRSTGAGIVFFGDRGALIHPILMANGRAVRPSLYDVYYNMSIDRFKKIIVQKIILGMVPWYIIYLTTKEDELMFNPGRLSYLVNGYYEARTFYTPIYTNPKNLKNPDLRTTVHWEPNIITDAKGEATISFYNADPKTTVRIIVEGVKATGGAVTGSVVYMVK